MDDLSGEVFWTRWIEDGQERIMLLNTDWTAPGNVKNVTLVTAKQSVPISIAEGTITIATIDNEEVSVTTMSLSE